MSLPFLEQSVPQIIPLAALRPPSVPLPGEGVAAYVRRSYRYCTRLTRFHSKSFYLSTQLLPPAKRDAVRVLYAFCRTSDDLIDLNAAHAAERLSRWRHVLHTPPALDDPVPLAWADVVQRYELATTLEHELLAGVEMDLSIKRYETFADLWVYCYRVASVVGLLSMQVIGHAPGAAPYAIKLGVALQLTNILRDIGEDAARNRMYLPLEDLAAFGVSEAEVMSGVRSARMTALLQFEIERAHRLYEESWPGIALLHPDSQFAVATAATVYRGILDQIAANNYDVFAQRAHLSLAQKLRCLPRIWWRLRSLNRRAIAWGNE